MAAALAPSRTIRTLPGTIETLEPEDIASLRLPVQRSAQSFRQAIERHPGRSVWAPSTLEYALVGAWRNRPEISSVDELVAVRHAEALLRAAFERCVEHGDELMLAIELETQRAQSRYERAGLKLIEEVITYETPVPREAWRPRTAVRLVPVDSSNDRAVDLITRLDQAAFPWLWRNTRTEFEVYLRIPGVAVSLIEVNDEPAGYAGATLFSGWGHIDRIALWPDLQGQGLGWDALGLVVDAMRRRGARRVALSTQRTNLRSQRLYERFGFRRTHEHDYRLFGRWCHPERIGGGSPA